MGHLYWCGGSITNNCCLLRLPQQKCSLRAQSAASRVEIRLEWSKNPSH